ncbi:hypothetical protein L1987_49837 [Smallanthus sonchifolius]|uniref:Uncharacterized protein n=1 Tax=Smallanthus sonchifolius TaxID=185202 RepID=A0ACB9FWD5_9ASTR|nr:hypothetical protein L1987_49837 [Smallanthus sonchifolius]
MKSEITKESPENPRLYSPWCFFAALPGPLFHDRIRSRVLSLLLRNLLRVFPLGFDELNTATKMEVIGMERL